MYEPTTAPYGRADQAAAWLLLARLYLNAPVYYYGNYWHEAENYARKVIESGYQLAPVYAHLFMADNEGSAVNQANREIILPIRQHGSDTRGWGGSTFLIAATHAYDMPDWGTAEVLGAIRARTSLIKKFFPEIGYDWSEENDEIDFSDAGDDRALFQSEGRSLYIYNVNDFVQGFSVTKWSNLRADGTAAHNTTYADTDIPFMRLSEAYLILAEALAMQGNRYQAIQTVNALRNRANAQPLRSYDFNTNEELAMEILNERSRELYFEGHRRSDLRRMRTMGYYHYTREYNGEYTWDWNGGDMYGTGYWEIRTYNLTNYSGMYDLMWIGY
ncbi:MAG: RagB/SusD family nutrient uptake outer membrane protein [Tannerellaceae bacterium]|nr:RagB/SusD family nutrient uptake outer membrane protein [Tannerellaceae bacterium]